jgi:hypothetical protein
MKNCGQIAIDTVDPQLVHHCFLLDQGRVTEIRPRGVSFNGSLASNVDDRGQVLGYVPLRTEHQAPCSPRKGNVLMKCAVLVGPLATEHPNLGSAVGSDEDLRFSDRARGRPGQEAKARVARCRRSPRW